VSDGPKPISEMKVDRDNLYREEVFTDLKVATIRRLTPIRPDGTVDEDRKVIFTGETQLLSQAGMLPIHCNIDAKDLEEAIEKFPDAVNRAVEQAIDEAREMQRREASRIVVPGTGGLPPGAAPPGGGPLGGGSDPGKIQLG